MVAWEAVRELLETLNRGRVVVLEGSFSWGGGGQTAASSASAAASSLRTIGRFSRFFGLDDLFRTKLLYLLNLGYALRIRLPLFISAGFVVCHFLSNYVPQVEINLQLVEDDEELEDDDETSGVEDEEVVNGSFDLLTDEENQS